MTFLELIEKAEKDGRLPYDGICTCVDILKMNKKTFNLFQPTQHDERRLIQSGQTIVYWGSGLELWNTTVQDRWFALTDLRLTVLLFCAVIDGEY